MRLWRHQEEASEWGSREGVLKPLVGMTTAVLLWRRCQGGQLMEMLRSAVYRCVEKDWAVDLGSKPKLRVLNSVCMNGFDGRCWKVKKSQKKV